jgi:5'-phosphate synthase pdxT subunit
MTIGVLALQGDYEAHEEILSRVLARREGFAARVVQVRTAQELAACDALVIPGGESTTMSRLCDRYELWEPLREKLESGMGAFGTCAGLIMLAKNLEGTTRNFTQKTLGALDIDVTRNAYGAQLDSFETNIALTPREYSRVQEPGAMAAQNQEPDTLRGVFIRAPRITRCGEGVEVLAHRNGEPVAVRQGKIVAAAFHPEVCGETRLHALWLGLITD